MYAAFLELNMKHSHELSCEHLFCVTDLPTDSDEQALCCLQLQLWLTQQHTQDL